MFKPTYCIPQPQRLRRIQHSFAWIDHRLLRSGFLQTMTHQDQSLYLFLALAADRNGVSFYRKEKACDILGLDFGPFEVARDRLIELGLIAFQPYSALSVNGFYQLLPVDGRPPDFAATTPVSPAPLKMASVTEPGSQTSEAAVPPAGSQGSPQPVPGQASPPSAVELARRLAAAFKTV